MHNGRADVTETVSCEAVPRTRRGWGAVGLLAASGVLCLAMALCYLLRADGCAAITVFPAWVWAVPGLLLALAGWRMGWRAVVALFALWVLYLGVVPEEGRVLLAHRPLPPVAPPPGAIRVVSLNCGGGNPLAADEVLAYHPDIVLLQESPSSRHVEALARRLFPQDPVTLVGVDAAIITHGRLEPMPPPRSLPTLVRGAYVYARVTLPGGRRIGVVSLRLLPPLLRMDLWSPACWRDQRENRQLRRAQLRAITGQYADWPTTEPLILGGDFNAPAGDAVCRLLTPRLHDAFREGGAGWGNTHMSDLPLLRIDQIWLSPNLRATAVTARPTRHSDHRMVVCDLVVR